MPLGAKCTADHLYAIGVKHKGLDGSQYAVVIYDLGTNWLEVCPVCERSALDAQRALMQFAGPDQAIGQFYSDNAKELKKAAALLSWCHPTNTPFESHTD